MKISKDFIPGTSPRQIAPNIFFQPIRSWHSNTYAGEGLHNVNGDGSGCLREEKDRFGLPFCSPPLTVTHRIYWNEQTNKTLSVFLSYPNAMGSCASYFWEVYPVGDDIARFQTEAEMEVEVVKLLTQLLLEPPQEPLR